MKSGLTFTLFLLCHSTSANGAFNVFFREHFPIVSTQLDVNKTKQDLFCPRCVQMHNVFLPNTFMKSASTNNSSPHYKIRSRRDVVKTNVETLKGGLLVTKGIYDLRQLEAQLENKTYKLHEDSRNRFFYSLHRHLADFLNYSLEIKLFHQNKTSDKDVQLLNALISGQLDLTISPIVSLARKTDELFVEFLPAFQTVSYQIVLKQPRRIQSDRALILQLRPDVWLCIGALGVFSAASLYVIQKVFTATHSLSYNEFTVTECILMVISAFAQQGIPIAPLNNSGRIVCAFVLVLGLMISTYYNAATVNALLTHAPKSIQTIEQIIANGHQIMFQDDPIFHYPATRTAAISERVWNNLPRRRTAADIKEGLESVRRGNGLCGEKNALYAGIRDVFKDLEKCDVSFITTSIPLLARSCIQRDSKHREMMFRGSLRLKEHGLIDRQSRHWFPPKPICTANPKWAHVDLTTTAIAMAIILCGLVAAFLFFLLELTYHALSQAFGKCKEHEQ